MHAYPQTQDLKIWLRRLWFLNSRLWLYSIFFLIRCIGAFPSLSLKEGRRQILSNRQKVAAGVYESLFFQILTSWGSQSVNCSVAPLSSCLLSLLALSSSSCFVLFCPGSLLVHSIPWLPLQFCWTLGLCPCPRLHWWLPGPHSSSATPMDSSKHRQWSVNSSEALIMPCSASHGFDSLSLLSGRN